QLAFDNGPILTADTPVVADHAGRFVILQEPILDGRVGVAKVCGTSVVKIDMADADHIFAEVAAGSAVLDSTNTGSVRILYVEPGVGEKWALVRFGESPLGRLIPVDLDQVGGEQGDEGDIATWTYDVLDIETGDKLLEAADPVDGWHNWRRPAAGFVTAATFGYAHYELDGEGAIHLVIGWINEVFDQEECT
ncbi:unnamed protein product, partial [marine sediment metagenome]